MSFGPPSDVEAAGGSYRRSTHPTDAVPRLHPRRSHRPCQRAVERLRGRRHQGRRFGTGTGPDGDASRLGDDWRSRIPKELAALADAWRNPDAWEGMTRAGGIDLPAAIAGKVALNELVIHGWDVARASQRPGDCDPRALSTSMELVSMISGQEGGSPDGLFGPAVDVPADAPLLDRVNSPYLSAI